MLVTRQGIQRFAEAEKYSTAWPSVKLGLCDLRSRPAPWHSFCSQLTVVGDGGVKKPHGF